MFTNFSFMARVFSESVKVVLLHETNVEVIVAVLIILGFIFEDKLVDFEERIFTAIKRKLLARRSKTTLIQHAKIYCDNKSNCA